MSVLFVAVAVIVGQPELGLLSEIVHDVLMPEQIVFPVQIDQLIVGNVDVGIFLIVVPQLEIILRNTNLQFGQHAFHVDGEYVILVGPGDQVDSQQLRGAIGHDASIGGNIRLNA